MLENYIQLPQISIQSMELNHTQIVGHEATGAVMDINHCGDISAPRCLGNKSAVTTLTPF